MVPLSRGYIHSIVTRGFLFPHVADPGRRASFARSLAHYFVGADGQSALSLSDFHACAWNFFEHILLRILRAHRLRIFTGLKGLLRFLPRISLGLETRVMCLSFFRFDCTLIELLLWYFTEH